MGLLFTNKDITELEVESIVNAANEYLAPGGGVCGAIFAAAGRKELAQECRSIGHCSTGSSVITGGYKLKAKYIIHTVGPRYLGGKEGEEALLRSCYVSALALCKEKNLSSIAFPLISAGIFGYPKDEALWIAIEEIERFLSTSRETDVYLSLWGRRTNWAALYKNCRFFASRFTPSFYDPAQILHLLEIFQQK